MKTFELIIKTDDPQELQNIIMMLGVKDVEIDRPAEKEEELEIIPVVSHMQMEGHSDYTHDDKGDSICTECCASFTQKRITSDRCPKCRKKEYIKTFGQHILKMPMERPS